MSALELAAELTATATNSAYGDLRDDMAAEIITRRLVSIETDAERVQVLARTLRYVLTGFSGVFEEWILLAVSASSSFGVLRVALGLSLEESARITGRSVAWLARVEDGSIMPTPKQLGNLTGALAAHARVAMP